MTACVYLGCAGPISVALLDGSRMLVRHGTDGEAVRILPMPRDDQQIAIALEIIEVWVLRVHDYERESLG